MIITLFVTYFYLLLAHCFAFGSFVMWSFSCVRVMLSYFSWNIAQRQAQVKWNFCNCSNWIFRILIKGIGAEVNEKNKKLQWRNQVNRAYSLCILNPCVWFFQGFFDRLSKMNATRMKINWNPCELCTEKISLSCNDSNYFKFTPDISSDGIFCVNHFAICKWTI